MNTLIKLKDGYPDWHVSVEFKEGEPQILCKGLYYTKEEVEYEKKVVTRKGITCPNCEHMVRIIKKVGI